MAIKKLAVQLGNVSVGQEIARIGVTISRDKLTLEEADALFVQKRLWGKLIMRKGQDADNQTTLPDHDGSRELDSVFDSKALRVTRKAYVIGLSFNIDEKIERDIVYFAKRNAYLRLTNTTELEPEPDPNPVPKDKPGQGRLPLKDVPTAKAADDAPVDSLGLPAAISRTLVGAGYETVGDVKKAMKNDKLVDVLTEVQCGKVLAAIEQTK